MIKKTPIFWIVTFSWVVLNFIQAAITPIIEDEAYYALYSDFLDWGYFDHPPMVALYVKIGYFFSKTALGLRFFTVISSAFCAILLYKIAEVKKENELFFVLLIYSSVILTMYSFIATPDQPLFLFSILFLYGYKQFLTNKSLKTIVFLGITVAFLLYSKYSGIFLLFFLVLSNPRLLLQKELYIIAIIAFLCFIPHLYWQYSHDFPSFRYHLSERSEGVNYTGLSTLEYLGLVALMFSPFLVIFVFRAVLKIKKQDLFLRGLTFVFWGTLLFFLGMTFKDHVQPQWPAVGYIAGLLLTFYYYADRPEQIQLFRFQWITIFLLFIMRIIIVMEWFPRSATTKFENLKGWQESIEAQAKELPVVFMNSFQEASLYTFYSQKESFSLRSCFGRKDQFTIWQKNKNYLHKPIFFVIGKNEKWENENDAIPIENTPLKGYRIQDFEYYPLLKYKNLKTQIQGDSLVITLEINNPYSKIDLSKTKLFTNLNHFKELKTNNLYLESGFTKIQTVVPKNQTINKFYSKSGILPYIEIYPEN